MGTGAAPRPSVRPYRQAPSSEPSPVRVRPRLGDWAELLRVSALFTVPGDALAGAAASGARPRGRTLLAIGSSLCLYEAGMALNDWADREVDAVERPHRPLPSGRITPFAALAAAAGLTAAGLVLASLAGRRPLAVAGALAGAVWAYDLGLKNTPAGPLAMAGARSLDLLLGAVATTGRVRPALSAAALLGAHTFSVTTVSRREAEGGSTLAPLAGLAVTAVLSRAVAHGRAAGVSGDGGPPVTAGGGAPLSGDGGAQVSAVSRAPASAGGGAYVPADGRAPVSVDGGAHISADGRAPASAGGGAHVSAGGGAPLSGDGGAHVSAGGGAPLSGDGGAHVSAGGGPPVARGLGTHLDPTPASHRPPAAQVLAAALGLPGPTPAASLRAELGALYALTAAQPLFHALLNPSPQLTQRAVGGGIRAMIPLQAALAARAGRPGTALVTASLAPLARRFARKVSVT
ncbi:UbiA family prenyltransferase [Streptomyces sp. TRM66268-LWL]|uniref:UbiA family prenyltransferase n=2 Tax=Streptomyces polyasparticus TaxID=2767826 RepID=A0ABR7SES1_9ACTN|nr:UbiA family prenyltransferase [Streptomyces polyasparticus]